MFNIINKLFQVTEVLNVVSWRSIFEGTRRLMGLLLRVPLIVTLRLHTETGLAAVSLARFVFRHSRKSGLLHTALYLKQCSVSLQRYYAGSYRKQDTLSCVVSLTRTGIPKVIPVYLRKIIRRRDDRADKWVRIYLSWFGLAKLIQLAPKVSKDTFSSISKPSEDIRSVEEVLSLLKCNGQRLISTYLPFAQEIPLQQGFFWEPTWKTVPLSTKFVSRYRSLEDIERKYVDTDSILTNMKHELAGFMWNVNKIHSIQDGFFSPGCLWEHWTIYPMDHKRTTEIAMQSLEWFERRIGPHMSSIVNAYQIAPPVPLFTGKLAQTLPGAGKRRIFAICNFVKQGLLKPVHTWAMKILSKLPMDGTFHQERPLLRLSKLKPNETYSFDLKSATDRWPLSIIFTVFALFFGRTYASSVVNSTLGLNTFRVDKPIVSKMYEIAFQCGQPLGYYGSWSLFALSHHFMVWLAAELAVPDRRSPFRDYAVLGDDVLIADKQVALKYRELLNLSGVSISESKSIISETGCIEFAKKFWVKQMQVDLSPVSVRSLLSAFSSISITQIAVTYKLSFNLLLRLSGAGYRVRARQNSLLARKWERLRAIQSKLTTQTNELPITFWLGRGLPLNPYVRGKIVHLLRDEYKPKEIRLPPNGLMFEGEIEICERTVLYGWMKQWLKWVHWYYSVACSPDVTIEELLDAPVCATKWYRTLQDENRRKFGIVWKCYDLVVEWPVERTHQFVIGPDVVIKHSRWILGGFSGSDFIMEPID